MTQKIVNGWEAKARQKRAEVSARIPREWLLDEETLQKAISAPDASVLHIPRESGLLTASEIQITESYDATALLEQIHAGALSAKEVTVAFCKRATIAHQLVNCLTEVFFDEAIERAEELDNYFQAHGKVKGPLHGLPISLKDSFQIRGIQSTLGYVAFLKNGPADSNSSMTQILLDAGAVLFVKTNVPQTLMSADTINNVFGRTVNPHKLSLGPGGSSGGEGALVALRGSLLGVGTDIGGSIRVPALSCGLYGFRPTVNRIPFGKQVLPLKIGWPGIDPCAGPLATSARDVRLLLQSVIGLEPWKIDWSAQAIPWKTQPEDSKNKRLSIGVIVEDAGYPVTPPVRRTIRAAAAKLEAEGHQVTFLSEFPSIHAGYELALDLYGLDDGTGLQYVHDGEEPFVKVVEDVLELVSGRYVSTKIPEFGNMALKRNDVVSQWHGLFTNGGYDVLITPSAEHTALPHDKFCITPYTAIWNLVDFPACVVPFLAADETLDGPDANLPLYNPKDVHGAPGSIQVVGLRQMDEDLINAVEIISRDLEAVSPAKPQL